MKLETINDEKILTISESEFFDVITQVTSAYVMFNTQILKDDSLKKRFELAEKYGTLTFVLKEVLFENADFKSMFEENSDYSEEEK